MLKDTIVPTSVDHEAVELNIVLDNVLVILHLQVIDSIFSIGSGMMGSMGPNWVWRFQTKVDQSSIQSGTSSELRSVSSKYSRAVPQR